MADYSDPLTSLLLTMYIALLAVGLLSIYLWKRKLGEGKFYSAIYLIAGVLLLTFFIAISFLWLFVY